jgi:hypothetical protein
VLDYKVWNENRMTRNCILICMKLISAHRTHRPMLETILVSIKACVLAISTPILMVIQLSSLTLRSQQIQILGETNHHSWGFSGFPPSHQTKGPWSMWYYFCHKSYNSVISATDKYVMSLQNKYSSMKSVSCIGNNFLSLFHDICKLYRTLFHVIPFLSLSFMFWSTLCHEISMDQNLLLYINRNSSSYTTRTSFYGTAVL